MALYTFSVSHYMHSATVSKTLFFSLKRFSIQLALNGTKYNIVAVESSFIALKEFRDVHLISERANQFVLLTFAHVLDNILALM